MQTNQWENSTLTQPLLQLLLSIWTRIESFCEKFKHTAEFLVLRQTLIHTDQLQFDLQLVHQLHNAAAYIRPGFLW